jgi:hypothetical protein
LNGVLAGFLGTYTSRYSDFLGYWLFGLLVDGDALLDFDLLADVGPTGSPDGFARHLASLRFAEQLRKVGFERSVIQRATLCIERPAQTVERMAGDYRRIGFDVRFRATVVADTGRRFEREVTVFVAPHHERVESRSAGEPA